MSLSDPVQDSFPIPRSREENQERAYVAASRRKDRSLDAKVESANRASMLHKKRTGKALKITQAIVENEEVYEEIDELYQEKRLHMLKTLGLQVEEQLHSHLLASFTARTCSYSNEYSDTRRRENRTTARFPCLSSSQGRHMLPSQMVAGDESISTPMTSFDHNTQTYMACMKTPTIPLSNRISIPFETISGQASVSVSYQIFTPARGTQDLAWPATHQRQIPAQSKTPSGDYMLQMWHHQTMEQARILSDIAMQLQKFRNDLESTPETTLQHQVLHILSDCISTPTCPQTSRGYLVARAQSQSNFELHPLTQCTHFAQIPLPLGASSTETPEAQADETPNFCSTPSSSLSCTRASGASQIYITPTMTMGRNEVMVFQEVDPDFIEFNEFALHLGNLFPKRL